MSEIKNENGGTSANYIIYVPKVVFSEIGYVEELFYPYQEIAIYVTESYLCPFCGQIHDSRNSECYAYRDAIINLLKEQYGFHSIRYKIVKKSKRTVFYRSVDEIAWTKLSKSQIRKFGPDFWDFSELHRLSGKMGFRLANPYYESDSEEVGFYWKNLETKEVFLCSVPEITYEKNAEIIFENKDDGSVIVEYPDYNALVKSLLSS